MGMELRIVQNRVVLKGPETTEAQMMKMKAHLMRRLMEEKRKRVRGRAEA